MTTSQEGVNLGVAIYSNDKFNLIRDSVHESHTAGHYVMGVFRNKNFHVIVAGVYGPSNHSDIIATEVLQQLNDNIVTLKQLYDIQTVIVAGDFNVTLSETDSSSGRIIKPRATAALKALLETHNLSDSAQQQQPVEHTWYRRGTAAQSSRIDYVFTSTPLAYVKYSAKFTINLFDHAMLRVSIGKPEHKKPAMKDFILAKDEFLIEMTEEIQRFRTHFALPPHSLLQDGRGGEEDDLDFLDQPPPPAAQLLSNSDLASKALNETLSAAQTYALAEFDIMINNLQATHDRILKKEKKKRCEFISQLNNEFRKIKKTLRNDTLNQEEKAQARKNI